MFLFLFGTSKNDRVKHSQFFGCELSPPLRAYYVHQKERGGDYSTLWSIFQQKRVEFPLYYSVLEKSFLPCLIHSIKSASKATFNIHQIPCYLPDTSVLQQSCSWTGFCLSLNIRFSQCQLLFRRFFFQLEREHL